MSSNSSKKIILVTGVSSGLGKAIAEYLHDCGYRVYGTVRKPLATKVPYTLLSMDVTDPLSVDKAIQTLLDKEGHIDVLINNAGMGIAGAIEDTSIEEAKAQFESNFFGVLRLCQAVLPSMRAKKTGMIINISSIAGLVAVPFQGLYSASKFAVEGLSESLRMETREMGINIVLVEPGDFKTNFSKNRHIVSAALAQSAYKKTFLRTLKVMEKDELHGYPANRLAVLIGKIIKKPRPKARYSCGPLIERLAIILKHYLPSALFEWIVMKSYKL